ncbi:hypothetical protein MTQ01_06180 [Streptomyces sp. XM4193]|uniref:hypothetical protein n=1 Tax=Streptomyces sp. XM4193 TaxID=2929782 RepID=UPI001FF9E7D0|nr:hypothetical protein [Streptomyces sp. XM4193]MCK1795602.1 hypothetical protein [Streptomyces sp. XM4193]
MKEEHARAVDSVREAIASLGSLSVDPTSAENIEQQYAEEGFEMTEWLRSFLDSYEGLTIRYPFMNRVCSLSTTVEACLEAPHATPRSMRIYSKRIGIPVLPVGAAFETEDSLLLARNGDFLFASDAGIQWFAHGFESSARALVTGDWDRTFHSTTSATGETLAHLLR